MCDCLIIGFNDYNFEKYVEMVRSFGVDSGAYKDLDLAIIRDDKKPYRALEILSRYRSDHEAGEVGSSRYHNMDFIWPTILYLGSYLKKRGFSFDYVNLFHLEKEKLKEKLVANDILTIAITTTLYVIPEPIQEIIEFVRAFNTNVKIIVGGPYIGNQLLDRNADEIQSFFKFLGADIYVDSTEGENALANVLKALKQNESLEGINNIAYRKGDGFSIGPKVIESNPLEENPVQYNLFPREEVGEFVSLRTAKSCPFACSFCGFPQRAGKYKYISVELVEKELSILRDIGSVSTLTFLDDTFNVPKERFKEILRMMIRNKYGFRWNSFLRSDHTDEEAIQLMAEAGCDGVFLGVESGSDAMLQRMNKTARTKDYRKAITLLKAGGIFSHANLVIGFPGESMETFRETLQFIEDVQPDSFRAQLWYADPMTPVWKKKEELGIKGSGFNWSHNTMDWRMASDLVDQMFLSVQNSVWLPQNGFELWSIYYLQRKGMSVKQIKTFLNCFNTVVREKLVYPDRETADPVLLENLRRSCKFDSVPELKVEDSGLFSAFQYCSAEKFWMDECGSPVKEPGLFPESSKPNKAMASLYFKIDGGIIEEIQNQMGSEIYISLLTGYGMALARWKMRDSVVMVTDLGGEGLFPLRMNAHRQTSCRDAVEQTRQKISRAKGQLPYAFHILTNQYRMASRGFERPVFESAYIVSKQVGGAANRNRLEKPDHQKITDGLKLTLEIIDVRHEVRARFLYDADCLQKSEVEELASSLKSIFKRENASQYVAGTVNINGNWSHQ